MADNPNEKRNGASAKSLQETDAQAAREKMARLRAMRLAHEAANPPVAKKSLADRSPPRQKGKKERARNPSLSDWLSDQEQSGRRK
jgi:hypothetical protein